MGATKSQNIWETALFIPNLKIFRFGSLERPCRVDQPERLGRILSFLFNNKDSTGSLFMEIHRQGKGFVYFRRGAEKFLRKLILFDDHNTAPAYARAF